jgi:hypothetical protein
LPGVAVDDNALETWSRGDGRSVSPVRFGQRGGVVGWIVARLTPEILRFAQDDKRYLGAMR